MDSLSTAKIQINLKDGAVSLEGSEEFVKTQIEWLKELVMETRIQDVIIERVESDNSTHEIGTTTKHQVEEKNSADRYKVVFGVAKETVDLVIHTEESGKFSIISNKIKGTVTEKQVIYSLLYLLAKEFYGVNEASFEELRELCKNHGCLDSSNFSSNYNSRKELFIVEGKRRSSNKNIKLTAPGRNKAKELIASLAQ